MQYALYTSRLHSNEAIFHNVDSSYTMAPSGENNNYIYNDIYITNVADVTKAYPTSLRYRNNSSESVFSVPSAKFLTLTGIPEIPVIK